MYDAFDDPYCYPGTVVLKNLAGLRNQAALIRFETAMTAQRADEPFPTGRLSARHFQAIHRHLFQDVYGWAGRFRTIRTGKNGNMFCYPENIEREIRALFAHLRAHRHLRGLSANDFARESAHFLATLNAIHPFRDGNGRAQFAFVALIASQAQHPLNLERLYVPAFLAAMIRSFHGDEQPLAIQLRALII